MQNAVKLDEIDHKIMNLLYENARISVSEIGRIISMTQPAVKERMNKLEDQGVIAAYRTKFEPSKINKNIQAFIMFKTSQCSDFIQYCNAAPEVTDLYRISGEFNYMMKGHERFDGFSRCIFRLFNAIRLIVSFNCFKE